MSETNFTEAPTLIEPPIYNNPNLIYTLLEKPLDVLLEEKRTMEEERLEKKVRLNQLVKSIVKKIPWLNPAAIERLQRLNTDLDMSALHKGLDEKGMMGYFVEAAERDPNYLTHPRSPIQLEAEEKKAQRVYNIIHQLAFDLLQLEKTILPSFQKAIEVVYKRKTPPPLPKLATQHPPLETEPDAISGVREITTANPPAQADAA